MDTADRRKNLAGFAGLLRQAGVPVPDLVQQESYQRTGFAEMPPPAPIIPGGRPTPQPKPKWPGFSGVAGPGAQQQKQRAFPINNPPPGYGQ